MWGKCILGRGQSTLMDTEVKKGSVLSNCQKTLNLLEGHKGTGSGMFWPLGSLVRNYHGIRGYSRAESCWGSPALNVSLMEELIGQRIRAGLCWSGEEGDTGRRPPGPSCAAIPGPYALPCCHSLSMYSELSQGYFHLWIVVKPLVLLGAGRDKAGTSYSTILLTSASPKFFFTQF